MKILSGIGIRNLALAMCLLSSGAVAQVDSKKTAGDLQGVKRQLEQSAQREKQINRELSALEKEAREISARLIELAGKSQSGEAKMSAGEKRIAVLDSTEKLLVSNLKERRIALGELLVGLQRLERDPPPPLVAHPKDALAAIRSATLFGAIIPVIKTETTAIRRDLSQLKNVRASLSVAQKDLKNEGDTLGTVRAELKALLGRKKSFVRKTRSQLKKERKRTARLVARAKTLNQLLARIIKEEKRAAKRKTDEARRAEIVRKAKLLKPKIAFSKTVGQLQFPAHGAVLRGFNQKNKFGQLSRGVLLGTRKQAQVTAPASGVVEFAGKFRSYGQLLILNVGEGYRMLFGGLGRIDVETGQQVNAGEPVGVMGNKAARGTLITSALDVRQPVLYIEFRKNGGPVDPANWWLPTHKKVEN